MSQLDDYLCAQDIITLKIEDIEEAQVTKKKTQKKVSIIEEQVKP